MRRRRMKEENRRGEITAGVARSGCEEGTNTTLVFSHDTVVASEQESGMLLVCVSTASFSSFSSLSFHTHPPFIHQPAHVRLMMEYLIFSEDLGALRGVILVQTELVAGKHQHRELNTPPIHMHAQQRE